MRFERLELERYGHFTGHSIDFGALSKEGDFHLIYGPNEAGKSTLRDACIDFLFGFERITPYNFKHPNASLLIGAELSIDGEKFNGQRVKRNTQSLRDHTGEPVVDGMLKAALGDVSRTHYLQMFSLDEDTLVEGGDEILKSQGDLGALLFSAASGLSAISSSLDLIQEKADGFYKPAGRSFRLNEHLKKLKALKDELKELDLQAPAYERFRKEAELAKTAHVEAKLAQDEKLAHADKLNALLQAAEIHTEYLEVTDLLLRLHDAPEVADGLREEVEKLYRDIASVSSHLSENQQALKRSKEASGEIELDTIVLENAAAIHRLSEGDLESRYRVSGDIEHRERDVAACEKEIRIILQKLGQPENTAPRSLVIPSAVLGNVLELLDQHRGLQVDLKNASAEVTDAEENLLEAQKDYEKYQKLTDLSDVSTHLSTLKSAIAGDLLEQKKKYVANAQRELNEAIAALAPWKGQPVDLPNIDRPDRFLLQKLNAGSEELRIRQKELTREISRLETGIAGQQAVILSLKSTSGFVDDQTAQMLRENRGKAWANHRAVFETNEKPSADRLRETASNFEAAMGADDQSTATRLAQSTELANFRQTQLDLAKNNAQLSVFQKQLHEVDIKATEVAEQISSLLTGVGLPQTFDAGGLATWLEKHQFALARQSAYLTAKSELDDLEKSRGIAQKALLSSMLAAGILKPQGDGQNIDLQALISQGEKSVSFWNDETRNRDQAKKLLAAAETELKRRMRQEKTVREASEEWQRNWTSALAGTWLADTSPAEVRHNLQLLNELDAVFARLDEFHQRIADMKHDRARFVDEVVRLAKVIGIQVAADGRDLNVSVIADQIRSRLATAEEDQRRLIERQKSVTDDEQRLNKIQDRFQALKLQQEALCKKFTADDLDELLAQLKRGEEKARLQAEADRLGKNICRILGARSLEAALEVLQEQCATREKLDELRREHSLLNQDRDREQEHLAQLYHQWKDAEKRLAAVGDDATVARLEEERQVLLLQVEQEAQSYMRLMAGTLMVGDALRTYRDVHRSAMMQRASEAFVMITGGNFSGLTSAPGKNGDILVGIRSDGTSIEVSQMSRGTAFQLYLALRIAGHAEFAKSRETLPFFADDILEPFDDDRSAETFKLLAEMSKLGQVVYLTHHKHLCQIARDVCGGAVHIHELPGTAVAG